MPAKALISVSSFEERQGLCSFNSCSRMRTKLNRLVIIADSVRDFEKRSQEFEIIERISNSDREIVDI